MSNLPLMYKNVIQTAIRDFNNIQDTLYKIGAKKTSGSNLSASDVSLIKTSDLSSIIDNQLQLKAEGTLTVTSKTMSVLYQNYSNENARNRGSYEIVTVQDADLFEFSINSMDMNVGFYSSESDSYDISANINGDLIANTPGWFSNDTFSKNSVKIGEIKKASFIEDNGVIKVSSSGYISTNETALIFPRGSVKGAALSFSNSSTDSPTSLKENAKILETNVGIDSYVTVIANRSSLILEPGYITNDEIVLSNNSNTAYISAVMNPSDIFGSPTATISLNKVTSFNSETGIVDTDSQIGSEVSVEIPSITVVDSNKYQDKYIIGNYTAKTNKGSATVNISNDTTGKTVDHYTEQLYKRLLGLDYESISDDNGNKY